MATMIGILIRDSYLFHFCGAIKCGFARDSKKTDASHKTSLATGESHVFGKLPS